MRHYLDHASSTPLRPAALEAVSALLERLGLPDGAGDPARLHEEGTAARQEVEAAREKVAALAGVRPSQVVFTSGGSEAANTAVAAALGTRAASPPAPVVCAAVEHSSVRQACRRHGDLVDLAVYGDGTVDLEHLRRLLAAPERPRLVNCQLANHELGTVQPVGEVAEACRETGVPLHVDAAAAFAQMPFDLSELGASYVSLSGHKMGAPSGVGALIVAKGIRMTPLLVGDAAERGRRAGAENLLGVVGFGGAAGELLEEGRLEKEAANKRNLVARLQAAAEIVEGVRVLGPSPEGRVPHILCLAVEGLFGEAALLGLDRAGIAVHSGSACAAEAFEPSPVIEAIGADPDRSLRLSVGWTSSEEDVSAFEANFGRVVSELRSLAGSGGTA